MRKREREREREEEKDFQGFSRISEEFKRMRVHVLT